MTREEAIKLLDPKTTVEALAEIEYYNGFSGHDACIKAIEDACMLAIEALQEPEIVHCKDCKCWIDAKYWKGTENIKQCSLAGYLIGERGYCLYGVKACEEE